MIRRSSILASLHNALARSRVVVLVGPRQSGKTTLARELFEEDIAGYRFHEKFVFCRDDSHQGADFDYGLVTLAQSIVKYALSWIRSGKFDNRGEADLER